MRDLLQSLFDGEQELWRLLFAEAQAEGEFTEMSENRKSLQDIIAARRQPIVIETDFISHVDGPCRDLTCPCRAEREVSVDLGRHMLAQYNRETRLLTITWKFPGESITLVLSPMETYRLLALLHAEMPASHE